MSIELARCKATLECSELIPSCKKKKFTKTIIIKYTTHLQHYPLGKQPPQYVIKTSTTRMLHYYDLKHMCHSKMHLIQLTSKDFLWTYANAKGNVRVKICIKLSSWGHTYVYEGR